MAIKTHYVNIGLVRIRPDGSIYYPSGAGLTSNMVRPTVQQATQFSEEHRILPDSDIVNSNNYPTIPEYLALEAEDGFKVIQISQSFIITEETSHNVDVHFAYIGLVRVRSDGSVYYPSGAGLTSDMVRPTIQQALQFTNDHRILRDSNVPNTVSYPTIRGYIALEAADDYAPVQLNQTFIVTQRIFDGT